jgi:hypothetical protein
MVAGSDNLVVVFGLDLDLSAAVVVVGIPWEVFGHDLVPYLTVDTLLVGFEHGLVSRKADTGSHVEAFDCALELLLVKVGIHGLESEHDLE